MSADRLSKPHHGYVPDSVNVVLQSKAEVSIDVANARIHAVPTQYKGLIVAEAFPAVLTFDNLIEVVAHIARQDDRFKRKLLRSLHGGGR